MSSDVCWRIYPEASWVRPGLGCLVVGKDRSAGSPEILVLVWCFVLEVEQNVKL